MVFNIVSLIMAILGIGIAIYQSCQAKRVKEVTEQYCQYKCKEIVKVTDLISREVMGACTIVDKEIMHDNKDISQPIAKLASQINSISKLTAQLVQFCEQVNEDHYNEFGKRVFDDIRCVLPYESDCFFGRLIYEQRNHTNIKNI